MKKGKIDSTGRFELETEDEPNKERKQEDGKLKKVIEVLNFEKKFRKTLNDTQIQKTIQFVHSPDKSDRKKRNNQFEDYKIC